MGAPIDKKAADFVRKWLANITDARKREKDYRREGAKCVKLYEAQDNNKVVEPFAILYSNTETLSPAVYNSVPIPVVDRRFKDADPVGKLAAETGTRILKFLIDAEDQENDSFDEIMQPAVLDTLVTNRGITRFKYDALIVAGQVTAECVYGEAIKWDKFLHAYARTWKKVDWICFEWDMNEVEFNANFPDMKGKVDFTRIDLARNDMDGDTPSTEQRNQLEGVRLATVYEVWDKVSKTVFFISPVYADGPLKPVAADPLKLSGFFPIPKPMNFMRKISTLVPTPLYTQYESQARELNDLTVRLKKLIQACKVRGFYNSTIEGISKVLSADDNDMIPVENMSSMPEGMAMDKMLWLMPVQDIANTVQVLYLQREQCKQVIYEITGVSDILRGATQASETATAQTIKNQWGTLRLKRMQKEVQRYCRDSLRIMLEIGVKKFSVETISAMTGLPYPTQQQKAAAGQAVQQSQAMAAQAQQMAQMAQQSGQQAPPPPPPLPPQVQEAASSPSWEEIIGLLRNDTQRNYRVDIETNSTIDAEATQDKQDIAELLNSISQFLNGVAPLIETGMMPFEVAQGMLLAITRRFTFGPQLEDALAKMKAPEPKPDPAQEAKQAAEQQKMQMEQQKGQLELQKMQMEMEADKARADLDMQMAQQQAELEKQKIAMEMEVAQMELALKREEMELSRQEMSMKADFAVEQHKMKLQSAKEMSAQKLEQAKSAPKAKEPA